MNQLIPLTALVAAAGERAQLRFWEFFVSNVRNRTRAAPTRAVKDFLTWREQHDAGSIALLSIASAASALAPPSSDG